ncbi:MAG: nucleotidyltransferase domain-containing protein [Bdellovibrionaceae bacterium]|nr:nucleotidyltransferase domain-containing protein [Pseudobdellovibrionaceae bacterium]
MRLLKLRPDPKLNAWALGKAHEVLGSIPSKHLILEAYLFGSAAEGTFTHDSDLDFLIVVANEEHAKILQAEVLRPGFTDIAVDWIFKTKESFEARKKIGGVCFIAHNNGRRLL